MGHPEMSFASHADTIATAERQFERKMQDRFYRRTVRDAIAKLIDNPMSQSNPIVMKEIVALAALSLTRIEFLSNVPTRTEDG